VVATVLLVDDDAAYRSSLRTFLEASYDLRVVGDTGDGREAVDLAARLRPDAVVVDLAMPGVGGLETAEAIAAVLPGVVIVVVTGSAAVPDDAPTANPHVASWLQKGDPLQVENVLRRLTARATNRP
jgi:DNA-binding NarL/FixJ family response regulator